MVKIKKSFFLLLLVSLFAACKQQIQKTAPKQEKQITLTPVEKIEKAHEKALFLSHNAISFSLKLAFGGKERLNGKLTLATDSSKGLIDFANGDQIYYIHDKVYYSPGIKNEKGVRFDAYTWSYFFLFPYKMSDSGTNWSDQSTGMLHGENYDVQTLTFGSGVGDAPDDWYVVYSDPKSHKLEAAAYIVTFGKTKENAEKDPHAIQYTNYQNVQNIPIATEWIFWGWTKTKGLTKQLGKAALSNFEFLTLEDSFFKAPEHFISK